MSWFTDKNNFAKISGILAILGMVTILIVDYRLCYMPLSPKEYSTFRAAMTRSREIILFYSKLAIAGSLLVIPGLCHFYLTLRRTHKILAWVTVAIYVFAYCNAALYYAYLAYIMSAAKIVSPIHVSLPFLTRHFYSLFQVQYYYSVIGGSIFLFISLSFFRNNYPKWFIWFNPLYLLLIFRFILPISAPPAYAGFFIPSSFNFVMLITMILSTSVLWKKSLNDLITDLEPG